MDQFSKLNLFDERKLSSQQKQLESQTNQRINLSFDYKNAFQESYKDYYESKNSKSSKKNFSKRNLLI